MGKLPTPRLGPSPFLEGTCIQFSWDSTALGWFKRCPRLYYLSMIEGWRAKNTSFHLEFGIFYTNALESYEKYRCGGSSHDGALFEVVADTMNATWLPVEEPTSPDDPGFAGGPWTTNDTAKNRQTLIRTIIWHLDQFKDDKAETIIAEDGTPLVERSFSFELDFGPHYIAYNPTATELNTPGFVVPSQPYLLCGHLDRVVSFIGATFVSDHKTTKSTIGDYYFDQYEPNNQMSLYTLAGQVVFHQPIRGVMIDAAQVAVGFSRFARGLTYRTQAQLDEWMRDLRHWLTSAEHYATEGYWPMNDTACFNCEYNRHGSKICAKDPSVRDSFLEAHFTKANPWNPLLKRN